MIKKALKKITNSKIFDKISNQTVESFSSYKELLEARFGKNVILHVINVAVILVSYIIASALIYPKLQFSVFLKEIFALLCAYYAVFLWFMDNIKKQLPIKTIVGVTACTAPVFFMNTTFSVAIVCLAVLIICEFVVFQYVRGCDLFSKKMPIYVICERDSDVPYIEELLSTNKVLKLIILSNSDDSFKTSAINSVEMLEKWLLKLRCLVFFPSPSRLIYFSQKPISMHLQQLAELAVKFSIPVFIVKFSEITEEGKNVQNMGIIPLELPQINAVDKSLVGNLFKSKRVWICYDGKEYVLDLIKSIGSISSIDLLIFCKSEYVAVTLNQHLISLYPNKSFNIKIMEFDGVISQDNKPDILFYNMPICSSYSEEHNQKEAVIGNILRTYQIIKFAQENKVCDVFILSSIKAFNANTWIGATQRLGELLAQFASSQSRKLFTKFHVIRLPDDSFTTTEIYGEIVNSIKYNGYINIHDKDIPVLQREKEIFPILVKAVTMSLKNTEHLSSVLTVSIKSQTSLDEIIRQACFQMKTRIDEDIRTIYTSEPRLINLDSFPNISETLEKTSIPNIFATRFTHSNDENFENMWTIEEVNKMSTRELVSAVMQGLNDCMKLNKNQRNSGINTSKEGRHVK